MQRKYDLKIARGCGMKRKHADRLDWSRVLNRNFISRFIDEVEFKGHITLISINQVKEPLKRNINGQDICLVDDGYYWMQHFPSNSNYCVTTMFNEMKEVVQWYFDISKSVGVTEQGIPYWDDLYLDIVVFPNGDFYIKDEDELEEALNRKHIEEDDYRLAKNIMNGLIKEIETMENNIIKNCMNHFIYILMASQVRY
jgi:predicted RNA-binding protein associated with RNAse of E/G family